MSSWKVKWNRGMTAAVVLLVVGGACILVSEDMADPLWQTGVGILVLASVVYLGARAWMMTRKRDR